MKVVNSGGKIKDIEEYENVNVLSLRSTWENKNMWKRYFNAYKLKKLPDIKNPKGWLIRYPNSIKFIKQLVPEVRL